jgi:biotin operon repressor
MKNIIAKVLTEQATEDLAVVSLEEEIHHITESELARTEVVSEMGDSSRTLELIAALEGLAIVADTIRQPTPQEAALIQIAGDTALAGTGLSGEEITPSMEDAESGVSVSTKVRTAIEQILRALKELLARVAKMVRTYVQHARAAAGGHVQRQKMIKERLMKASHSLNSEVEFTMTMPVADGKTLTSLSEVVDEALKFSVAVDWFVTRAASFNIDYASGFVDLYSKLGMGDKGITVIEQFAILNKIADQTGHIANAIPHAHVKADTDHDYFSVKTQQTVQLLGGISIAVTSAKPIEHNTGLSSASIKHAVHELTEVGIKVHAEAGGFYKEAFLTKPLNQAELHKAFDLAGVLIEHFTAKSDHTALAAATARRSEFAETAVDHLTRYTEKFKKDDVAAKEYGSSALRISQSVMANATVPYTQMTTAVSRVINLLQGAMLKSLNAHEGTHEAGLKEVKDAVSGEPATA